MGSSKKEYTKLSKSFDYNLIKNTSRNLRKNYTDAEKRLWYYIRNKQINGKRFVRQYPIKTDIEGNKRFFIADFYCDECKLAIELDGVIHDNRKELDSDRSYLIICLGIRVVRYDNDSIMNKVSEVLENLRSYLETIRL